MKVGEPGYPVSAVERAKGDSWTLSDQTLEVGDHDFIQRVWKAVSIMVRYILA